MTTRKDTPRNRAALTDRGSIARDVVNAPRGARRKRKTKGSSLGAIANEITTTGPRIRGAKTDRGSLAAIANEITAASPREANRGSLAEIANDITTAQRNRPRRRPKTSLADVARAITSSSDSPPTSGASPLDLALPARPIAMELISGRGHYERVLHAVLAAKVSVWIATANVKELMVEDSRARPGKRRSMKKRPYVSVLAHLDDLAARGVELRLLHAELPSGPFRQELAQHPRLVGGGLALRRCPRVHLKAVIVDGELLYLGSANWTGAGLGAKGSGRRNFELGFVTDDAQLLDQVQALYEQIWSGGECDTCKLHDDCPGPLVQLRTPAKSRG